MIRRPAVAGQFYPGSKETLKKTVEEYLNFGTTPKKVLGLAAPHAGYIYSGQTAGHTYASAVIPKRCIVISPNHTGMGASAAIMSEGEWVTPIGNARIDKTLASSLMSGSSVLKDDTMAHIAEHSLEVQLPFLLALQPALSFVPITVQHLSYAHCEELGRTIASVIKSSGENILIIASTDMNHYEEEKITERKDNLAIAEVLELDPKGLLNVCAENDISMCGVIPTAIMLIACKELGAKKAELVEHTTSGEASGDYSSVVGYAGFIVY